MRSWEAAILSLVCLRTEACEPLTHRIVAYDVIGNMTFGKPHGYLEKQSDFDDTISSSDRVEDYFAMVGMVPGSELYLMSLPTF